MTMILGYQNKGLTRDIIIQDAVGGTITPGVNDKVRATIYREGETPVFTVTSGTPTAAGSSFTKGATNRLRIDATDMSFRVGTYCLRVDYFDNADAAEWKEVEQQCFVLMKDS